MQEKTKLEEYKNKIAITKDGYQVEVNSNIGKPSDIEDAIKFGADGIGLFRTEFLFMDSNKCQQKKNNLKAIKKSLKV